MILERLTLILVSSIGLAGCAASPLLAPDYIGRYPGAETALESTVPPDAALASLPGSAGSVLSVRDTTFSNGLRQTIVLDGPRAMTGENKIVVEALTPPMAGVAPGNDLRLASPSDADIQSELSKLFPGVVMQVSGDVERGPQGPFGYAAGKSGGLNCLYAWEYLAPRRPLTLIEGASGTGTYPASVRVRLCRVEPLADLLVDMRRLVVTPPGSYAVRARVAQAQDPVREDALEAAVGPMERLPVAKTSAAETSAAGTSAAGTRSTHHVRLAQTRPRQHGPLRRRRDPGLDASAFGRSTVPPVPLPGDLAPSAGMAPAAMVPAARSATVMAPRIDQDSMPLPK